MSVLRRTDDDIEASGALCAGAFREAAPRERRSASSMPELHDAERGDVQVLRALWHAARRHRICALETLRPDDGRVGRHPRSGFCGHEASSCSGEGGAGDFAPRCTPPRASTAAEARRRSAKARRFVETSGGATPARPALGDRARREPQR